MPTPAGQDIAIAPPRQSYRLGRFDEAEQRAISEAADPGLSAQRRAEALAVLADLQRDRGDFTAAMVTAAQAWTTSPHPAAAIALAELRRNRGQATLAADSLEQALAVFPDHVDLLNHLGLALRHACRPDEAMAAFQRAGRLRPNDSWAATNLAFGWLRDPGERAAETFSRLGRADDRPVIGLGIFCDRFPHTYGFLLQQYSSLLRHFADARVYSFGRQVFSPYAPDQFGRALHAYGARFADVAERVHPLCPALEPSSPAQARLVRLQAQSWLRPRLAYTQFAMNADLFRPLFETLGIPFAFTLNPGGGFRLDNPYSDDRLARTFASPLFRQVIVTYSRTRDYVLSRFKVPENKVTLIHGTIVLEELLQAGRIPKRLFGRDKDSLDICFVGLRYSATGADKGYDQFIAAAHLLAPILPHLHFHVVGDFDDCVVDVTALTGRITFHGVRDQSWMSAFHAGMDAIVSPNAADHLAKGAFDGFPVTSCIEAGMCGVAVFATDPMGLNEALTPDHEVVIVNRDPRLLADTLAGWLRDPPRLYALAQAGERRFRRHWGEQAQMRPRIQVLERLLAQEGS